MSESASASEPVGSVSEEAFKLFRALSSASTTAEAESETAEPHVCTAQSTCTSWCPVCQVVGLVRDNQDAVAQVSAAAAVFAKSLRDLLDSAVPSKDAPTEEGSA